MPVYILANEFAPAVRQDLTALYGTLVAFDSSGQVSVAAATLPYGDVLGQLARGAAYVGIRGEAADYPLSTVFALRDRGGVTIRTDSAFPAASVEVVYDATDAGGQGYFVYDAQSAKIPQFRHITLLHELAHAVFQTVSGSMFTEDEAVEFIENSFRTAKQLPRRSGHDGGVGRPPDAPKPKPDQPPTGGGKCFTGGTLIATDAGDRPIASLRPGSIVLSYDARSEGVSESMVLSLLAYDGGSIRVVHTDLGDIETTALHVFLTTRGWVRAGVLRAGDDLVAPRAAGGLQRIVDAVDTGRREPVYTLRTSAHSFIADGCVVHDFGVFRGWQTWWHRTFVDRRAAASARAEALVGVAASEEVVVVR